jgi:hypothetical protein
MTANQKTIALVSFVILVAGGFAYFYFRKVSVPLEGVDKKDIEELKQIRMV